MGFRVWGLGFRVWGFGFRVWGLGFEVRGLGWESWGELRGGSRFKVMRSCARFKAKNLGEPELLTFSRSGFRV